MKLSLKWISDFVDLPLSELEKLIPKFTLSTAEVEGVEKTADGDTVFEVDNKSLTNRPDLWGHFGCAREFAAIAGVSLRQPELLDLKKFDGLPALDVTVDSEKVLRYSAVRAENITAKSAPEFMKTRLQNCGIRSINLLADITNYVMLEIGQPMHAFDAKKIDGIAVKDGLGDFEFTTLDGVTHKLTSNDTMICDKKKPVAIAGIMGGANSEIDGDTNSVVLESATFDAVSVRKTSTAIKLRTDSSLRYEKALDPAYCHIAAARALKLLTDIDKGAKITSKFTDIYPKKYPTITIQIDKNYIDKYTGIDISAEAIEKTLTSLGFHVGAVIDRPHGFSVTVPSWRATKDVSIKADLVEEISRIYGYDNFKIETTLSPLAPALPSAEKRAERTARQILSHKFALHEVHSYIWQEEKELKKLGIPAAGKLELLNPSAPENKVIRESIVPSLLAFVNENRDFAPDFGIYEMGRVFKETERRMLGIALFSKALKENDLILKMRDVVDALLANISPGTYPPPLTWPSPFAKGGIEGVSVQEIPLKLRGGTAQAVEDMSGGYVHPVNRWQIGDLGEMYALHPNVLANIDKKAAVVCAELDMGKIAAAKKAEFKLKEVSKFPATYIDLNLRIDDKITFEGLSSAWKNLNCEELHEVSVLNTFKDADGKSIALRFKFSSLTKTLKKEDVEEVQSRLLENFSKMGYALK